MRSPIEADDLPELERRVVRPVVQALLRDGELDELLLRKDAWADGWPSPEPGSVWLWFSARGETYTYELVRSLAFREGTDEPEVADEADEDWDSNLLDAEQMAFDLYDDLRDWLCESQLSWGELRDGDYDIPPPLAVA